MIDMGKDSYTELKELNHKKKTLQTAANQSNDWRLKEKEEEEDLFIYLFH